MISPFEDRPVRRWNDCVAIYGDPKHPLSKLGKYAPFNSTPEEDFDVGDRRPHVTIHSSRNCAHELFGKTGVKEALASDDFDLNNFAQTFIANEKINFLLRTIDNHNRGQNSISVSRRQLVAENIHNYVKAALDLADTQQQFSSGRFPNCQKINSIYNEINKVEANMSEFFSKISQQSTEASNASTLLSKIQNYSHIFMSASEIDRYRINGQFDEIYHVFSKIQNTGNVSNVTVFKKALDAVDKSLINVVDSLKSRLSKANASNFNKSHCELLIKIQKKGNPVFEMLETLDRRVRASFNEDDLLSQCSTFEEVIPFWRSLCETFEKVDKVHYDQISEKINKMLLNLISDFEDHNRKLLEQIYNSPSSTSSYISFSSNSELNDNKSENFPSFKIKHKSLPNSNFNSDLHHAVKRTYMMWSNITKMPMKNVETSIFKARQNLQQWYTELIHKKCHQLIKITYKDSGCSLIDYLIALLDGSEIYSPEKWLKLIIEPIYWLYDSIHENAFAEHYNLVGYIYTLKTLIQTKLEEFFVQYDSTAKVKMPDQEKTNLKLVCNELYNMLLKLLIRDTTNELNQIIYESVFGNDINWEVSTLEQLPVMADGWVSVVINKCLNCKVQWKSLWNEMKKDVTKNIACSLLTVVSKIPQLGEPGRARLEIDSELLKFALGNESPLIWKAIDDKIMSISKPLSSIVQKKKEDVINNMKNIMNNNILALQL